MKNIKFAVLAFGVLGLIGCFLPLISAEGMSFSFFDGRKGPDGVQIYLTMAGYALAAVMGAMGVAKGFKRPQAIASLVGFAFVVLKLRHGFTEMLKMAIGGKLMFIAVVGGVVASVIALAMPDDGK